MVNVTLSLILMELEDTCTLPPFFDPALGGGSHYPSQHSAWGDHQSLNSHIGTADAYVYQNQKK